MFKFIYQSPGRYVQGKGVIDTIADETERLGSHALIISDKFVWDLIKEKIDASFSANKRVKYDFEIFKGESSSEEIDRIVKDNEGKEMTLL